VDMHFLVNDAYIYIYVCKCIHFYIYMCIYTCIHIHVYIYECVYV